MDLLVLSDRNGVVDMTHEAIARRTNRPIEVIRRTVTALEGPDPRSRTPYYGGARLKRLDDHREWGWMILNYEYFRQLASEEQRREKTLARVKKHRAKAKGEVEGESVQSVTNALQTESAQGELLRIGITADLTFREEWDNFRLHRKRLRCPMTERAEELILTTLAERPEQSVEALQMAMIKGWKGFKWDWFDKAKRTENSNMPANLKDITEETAV